MGRRETSQDLKNIKNLKNIESIMYYDVGPLNLKGKRVLIPGFWVMVRGPELFMTYHSDDPIFEKFVQRLREVYLEENDDMINAPIKIDPLSKELLLNGKLEKKDGFYQFYQNQEGYKESLLFKEDRIRARLPIIIYHLKETAKFLAPSMRDLTPSKDVSYFSTIINKEPKKLLLEYEEDDNSWELEIGNLFNRPLPLKMVARIDREKMVIKCEVPELSFFDTTTYYINNNKLKKEREVSKYDYLLCYSMNNLEEVEPSIPNKWLMQEEQKKEHWYKTPWNGYIGVNNKKEVITVNTNRLIDKNGKEYEREEKDIIETTEVVYLTPSKDSLLINEMSTKTYYKKDNEIYTFIRIPLDRINRTSIGIIQKNKILLETFFDNSGLTGFGKKHLAEKYFYHIADLESIKDTIQFIGKNEGIYENVDLLDSKIYERRGL